MTIRLDQRLTELARKRPDAAALEWTATDGAARAVLGTCTWAQLQALGDRVADRLRDRLAPGSVVMLRWPNSLAFVVSFLAALRAGLKVFPVSPQSGRHELQQAAERSGAAAIIAESLHRDVLGDLTLQAIDAVELMGGSAPRPRPVPQAPPADPEAGLLLESSGTTGLPKIVFRDRPSLDAVAENVAAAAALRPDDRVLGVVQLSHSYGIENAMLGPLWAGAATHLLRHADAPALPLALEQRKITVLPAVPFLFEVLGDSGAGPGGGGGGAGGAGGASGSGGVASSLRLAYSAGAPLPPCVSAAFARGFGLRIGQLYGATEIGSVAFNHPDAPGFDPASTGRPMSGVSIRILDPEAPDPARPLPAGSEGHVAVGAPSMFRHYLGAATPEVVDGHFLTGDLGRLDAQGRLTITGRIKLLIDVGGMKVNPHEVEQVLLAHPDVRECVVVPLPITQTVERLKAVVVLRKPEVPFSPGALRIFAAERLAPHKVPRVIEAVAALPRSASGKVLREKLGPG